MKAPALSATATATAPESPAVMGFQNSTTLRIIRYKSTAYQNEYMNPQRFNILQSYRLVVVFDCRDCQDSITTSHNIPTVKFSLAIFSHRITSHFKSCDEDFP